MITPAFVFTIFMLTLGPMKNVPAFFAMTQDQSSAAVRARGERNHGGDRRCSGDDPLRGGSHLMIWV
jgi:hypothetical protein